MSSDNDDKVMSNKHSLSADFANETAHTKLISSDGTIFHIESFYLKAASTVFRDLIGNPDLRLTNNEPIAIDQTRDIVTLFLNLVADKKCLPKDLALPDAIALASLLDAYGCDGVKRKMADMMFDSVLPPRDRFIVASRLDAPNLARHAVKKGGWELLDIASARATGLDPQYALAFFLAKNGAGNARYCPHCRTHSLDRDANQLAQRFRDAISGEIKAPDSSGAEKAVTW